MGIPAGKLDLTFEASEWMAICELAQKHKTTPGAILRIGAVLLLEADRRGGFKLMAANAPQLLPPNRTDS